MTVGLGLLATDGRRHLQLQHRLYMVVLGVGHGLPDADHAC